MGAKVRRRRDTGAWFVDVTHAGQRKKIPCPRGLDGERRANELAAELNTQIERRQHPDLGLDPKGPLIVGRIIDSFLCTHAWKYGEGQLMNLRLAAKNHIVPAFGHYDLRDLRASDVNRYVTEKLDAGLAPATVGNTLALLRRIINISIDDHLIEKTPIRGLSRIISELQRKSQRPVAAWSHQERDSLLALAREREPFLYVPLCIGFYTGARQGEVFGLFWKSIDLSAKQLSIEQQWTGRSIKPPKWDSGRIVPLHPDLARVLRNHARTLDPRDPWGSADHVVKSPASRPWDRHNFGRAYRRLMRLAVDKGIRRLTFHCTRHTYATHAIEGGKSARWVSEQLGHRSAAFTLDRYGHLLPTEAGDVSFLESPSRQGDSAQHL